MIGWLEVGLTCTANPQPSRRWRRNPTWSAMPSPVRLTEAMRTESRSVRTSASERSRTAASIMTWSRERLLQLFEALHQLRRRLRGELALDHLGLQLHLLAPFGRRDRGGGGEALGSDRLEAGQVEPVGHVAERRIVRGRLALDPLDDPLEHAHVLAVARPDVLAVSILAEPVDEVDAWRLRKRRAGVQPVRDVVGYVVAAKRDHRERIPPHDPALAADPA